MSLKQVLVILGVLTLTLLMTIGGLVWVYKSRPEMLGMPSVKKPADSLAHPVLDSVAFFRKVEEQKKKVEAQWKKQVDSLHKALGQTQNSLSGTSSSLDSLKNEIKALQTKQDKEETNFALKMDSLTRANYQTFAKIYDNTNPPEVAQILQNIDGREAAVILKMMKKKQAGKVLEAMNPERAANILRLSSFDF